MTALEFDREELDYRINGKLLLKHLSTHERIQATSYIPAILSEPETVKRLEPQIGEDLDTSPTALYLCGHCGGWDGAPIGVKVIARENWVLWIEMGWWDWEEYRLFEKVRGFKFHQSEYRDFLACIQAYGSPID